MTKCQTCQAAMDYQDRKARLWCPMCGTSHDHTTGQTHVPAQAKQFAALREALTKTLTHIEGLEDDWQRGIIEAQGWKQGVLSNRNHDIGNMLRATLNPAPRAP